VSTTVANPVASFFAPGIPQPQGSKTAVMRGDRPVVIEGRRGPARQQFHSWRAAVAHHAMHARGAGGLDLGPLAIGARFVFPRPKGHFGKNGVRDRFVSACKTGRPDLDKLERALLDALTGVLFVDDSQVVAIHSAKVFGELPGVEVNVHRACACGDFLALCPVHGAQ